MKNNYYFREDLPMVITKEEVKEEKKTVKVMDQKYVEKFIS